MDFKVLLGDNSTIIIYTKEIIRYNNSRKYYYCSMVKPTKDIKVHLTSDLNTVIKKNYVEDYVVVELDGEFFPEKICPNRKEANPVYVKKYDSQVDPITDNVTAKFNEVIDPYGTVDDADNASRDRYYFKQGMKAAFQLLIEREFDFDEFKQNHPHEVGLFSSAIGCLRGVLRVSDDILKEDLKMMIERI